MRTMLHVMSVSVSYDNFILALYDKHVFQGLSLNNIIPNIGKPQPNCLYMQVSHVKELYNPCINSVLHKFNITFPPHNSWKYNP